MTLILWIAFLVSTVIKVFAIWGNNFAFTIDQGRDLVDVRNIVVGLHPVLVGPTTSINGVFLGPFYYYFISLPFALFGGSPQAILLWQILWFQISVLVIYFVIKTINRHLATITAILLFLSPVGFYTSRYFWNANLMPVFTILFFASIFWTISRRHKLSVIALGLLSGLALQIEAAFGILFFPFSLLLLFARKHSLKDIGWLASTFLLTLVPQVVFELRHQFLMTHTLLAGLSGKSGILGEKLTLAARFLERKNLFLGLLRDSNHISFEILGPVILLLFAYGIYQTFKTKNTHFRPVFLTSVSFLVFAGVFYLVFPQQVKNWYILGLTIPIIIGLSAVISSVYERSNLGQVFTYLFLLFSLYHVGLAHNEYLQKFAFKPSTDPSNLRNELQAINWVYTQAAGRPFKVYTYLPSVYDYPYQYLFWWYGYKKYGYHPSDAAYLPNQPEYIKYQSQMWTHAKPADTQSPIYLIIENDPVHRDRFTAWQGNFNHLCVQKTVNIVKDLVIRELVVCQLKK